VRIITGLLKGRVIPFHPRRHGDIRLTSSMLKEALFAMLGTDFEGQAFLDLCAGCGQIGLEARSRGARVTLNEPDPRRYLYLLQLLQEWDLEDVELHRAKGQLLIPHFQAEERRFDVVYLDPPYQARLRGRPLSLGLLQQVGEAGILADGGWCCVQHQRELELPAEAPGLVRVKERRYGDTTLSVYAPGPPTAAD
jgi:16S rRNA (guanine(966)-N(2))-methyltransferase RsmD